MIHFKKKILEKFVRESQILSDNTYMWNLKYTTK